MNEFKIGPLLCDFPDEAAIVGRLVLAYSELELALWSVVAAFVGNDDKATRMMFRLRGADAKLSLADALLRSEFIRFGYKEKYSNAMGQMKSCKAIRNELAHSYWDGEDGVLRNASLESAAKSKTGKISHKLKPTTIKSLKEKEKVFIRTHAALVELEELLKNAKLAEPLLRKVKSIQKPRTPAVQ